MYIGHFTHELENFFNRLFNFICDRGGTCTKTKTVYIDSSPFTNQGFSESKCKKSHWNKEYYTNSTRKLCFSICSFTLSNACYTLFGTLLCTQQYYRYALCDKKINFNNIMFEKIAWIQCEKCQYFPYNFTNTNRDCSPCCRYGWCGFYPSREYFINYVYLGKINIDCLQWRCSHPWNFYICFIICK